MPKEQGRKVVAQNKKARHDYHLEDTFEAGLVLVGTEVKSLRMGRASLVDGFVDIEDHEAWLHGVHIPEYTQGTWTNHSARRKRKLLLNRVEIDKIERKVNEKGFTIIPTALYFKDGRAKVEISLAKGKKSWDKRHALAERQADREKEQDIGRRLKGMELIDPPLGFDDARALITADGPVEATRQFWQDLGLPGLFDVHVHFLPPPIQARVYEQFDQAGPKLGRSWPIRYRGSVEERVALLRDLGVRRFSALPYAHRPGVAGFLNDWARQFAADVPESLWSATFFPEPDAAAYVADLADEGVEVFKIHVQVGDFRLDDPLLDDVWATLEDVGTPIVIHAGSGPGRQRQHRAGAARTGAAPLPAPHRDRRPPRRPGVRRVPDARRDLRAGPSRHHDGVHVVLRGPGAVPARSAGPPGRPRRQGAARQRPADDPLPLLPPARVTGRARSRGTLAAGRVLGQRSPPVRFVPWGRVRLEWAHNSRGADRFRLGTFVPGEAGRGASVISLTIAGNQ